MIPVGLGRNRLAPEGRTADGKDCRSVATRAETGPDAAWHGNPR